MTAGLLVWDRSVSEGEQYEKITPALLQPRAVVSLLCHSKS